ncbi:MarR family winged helix-turn-helix transcriptional regulator [Methanobrevibacter sp.]|uniref:MarR family winged helix-turn-helix transcriptional regulator n=1 Tax=Methanobrevibacter sp. TaxID=66852 RepID=UPI003869C878
MSLDEFKNMDCSIIPISNLIAMIARGQSIYMNNRLGDLGINETQLHLLFEISHHDNLNQEKIATRCNINKGAVARSIRKLEEKGFVLRTIDENNRRQNMVSLTDKGGETLSKAITVLKDWEDEVIKEKGYVDKELLQLVLREIAIKTMELNEGE